MTLKQCYQGGMELWRWLEANPDKSKSKWPKWEENGGKMHSLSYCFACEYCGMNCDKCPLLELWPKKCEESTSPYEKWCKALTPKNRSKYAKVIADFCEMKLKGMEGKQ